MKKILLSFVIVSMSGLHAQLAADDELNKGLIPVVNSTEEQVEFDPELVQKVREQKEFREKFHIAQELENVTVQKPKTFRVSNSKSKFAPIRKLMNRLRSGGMDNAASLDRKVSAEQNKMKAPNRNNNLTEK